MQKNQHKGKFIVFEGLDGSGQSTQAKLLSDFLIKNGLQVILTKEPTKDSKVAGKIKEILGKKIKIKPKKLQELFVEDRKEHLEKIIIPALKSGKIVVCDRYFFSTFAYGKSEGLDLEWLIKMNNEFLLPDITFILKVSPRVCVQRIEERGEGKQFFEIEDKLEKVWQTFEILPNLFENVYLIDGEKSIDEVFSEVKELISSELKIDLGF
jgi:dTMP kinase